MANVLTHYWGSYFKSRRHAENVELDFKVLIDRGWHCHLVLEREPEDDAWIGGLRNLGVTITCLPRPRGSFDFKNILAIRRLCLESRCTVFRCDNMHMSPLIGAFLAGVPIRIWCKQAMNSHFEQCLEPGWRERVALSTRLSALLSTRVIAVSSAVGGEITDLGFSAEKVLVLNNPRPEIRVSNASRVETRSRLGFPDQSLVLVTVGRAEKVKGWDILLKAFAEVVEGAPHARLLLVGARDVRGDFSFMEILDGLVKDLGLADKIHFAGHVLDMKAMLQAGDVFVLPSRSEGCCLALLEALELSLPCVATRVGNASEVLEESRAGLVVPRNDPGKLAAALSTLIDDDEMRREMASRAAIPDQVPSRLGHAVIVAELMENLAAAHFSSTDPEIVSSFR